MCSACRRWKKRCRKISDPSAIAAIKVDTDGLTSDIHAEADYRAHLVTVMAKRAVDAALS